MMNISGNSSKVLDDFLRALRFSSTGFASVVLSVQRRDWSKKNVRDKNALILAFFAHINPSTLCNCKYVRRVLISSLATILLNNRIGIEW